MTMCLSIMGIAVYAATTQNMKLSNEISISTDGQAKAIVEVYEQSFDGDTGIETFNLTEPTWGEAVATKTENEDSAQHDMTPIRFNQTTGKNAYAYKIVITNKSTVAVDVSITSSTESNDQIDVYCGETFDSAQAVENTKGVNFLKEDLAVDGTVTYYIIVCTNTALADMTATSAQTFDVDVSIDV